MTFRRLIAVWGLLLAGTALADAGSPDAGDDTPDASAGQGGAQMMTQEGDETMPNGPCSLTRDCERGFACVNGMCRYAGFRQASTGCGATPGGPALALALAAALRRPRRQRA